MLVKEFALPSIDDVASEAGVSKATVSRVLNRPDAVREPLRTRVQATALPTAACCDRWATCRTPEPGR